jgi:hypothetical protein
VTKLQLELRLVSSALMAAYAVTLVAALIASPVEVRGIALLAHMTIVMIALGVGIPWLLWESWHRRWRVAVWPGLLIGLACPYASLIAAATILGF